MGDEMSETRRKWRWWDVLAVFASRVGARPPEADLSVPVSREEAAAEWRWSKANAAHRAQGCPCGRAAQVANPHHDVMGTVPYLWWTCEDHAGAAMFSSRFVGGRTIRTAGYKHPHSCPLGEDMGHGGTIGQPPEYFYCPHRTHAPDGA